MSTRQLKVGAFLWFARAVEEEHSVGVVDYECEPSIVNFVVVGHVLWFLPARHFELRVRTELVVRNAMILSLYWISMQMMCLFQDSGWFACGEYVRTF